MKLHVTMLYDAEALREPPEHRDVLVFPELMDGGYGALRRGQGIHTLADGFVETLRAVSRRNGCTCIAGSLPLRGRDGTLTNSALVFRRGRLAHRYDKIHLFRPGGDTRYFVAGTGNTVFSLSAGPSRVTAGVIICFDLRFPELARMLAQRGMQVLFVPARWPVERDDAWRTLLKARAIENQIFVVGCNSRGSEGGFSYVFDPLGRLILDTHDTPHAPSSHVELDFASTLEAYRLHRNMRDALLLQQTRFPVRLRRPRSRRRLPRRTRA